MTTAERRWIEELDCASTCNVSEQKLYLIISRKTKNAVVKSTESLIDWFTDVVDLVAISTSLVAAEESRLQCL